MSNREIGMPLIVGYLGVWWGGMALLFVIVTGNTAPPPPALEWENPEPLTTMKLALKLEPSPHDVDGDPVTYLYSWTRNGELVEGKTGTSIASRETMSGEVWEVTATPDDGTIDSWGCSWPWRECAAVGKNVAKLSVTVGNTPPRARIRFNDAKGNELTGDEVPVKNDVHLGLSCFDPDVADRKRREPPAAPPPPPAPGTEAVPPEPEPDPCTYKIAWWRADAEPQEGDVSEYTDRVLPSKATKVDESWKAVVIANDGEADGEPSEETIKVVR